MLWQELRGWQKRGLSATEPIPEPLRGWKDYVLIGILLSLALPCPVH